MVYKFVLPCYMYVGNKKISLNLNWYRNAHYQVLNNVKNNFMPLNGFNNFKAKEIKVIYELVSKNRQRTDLMNWISVVDKFFMDLLVNLGSISDDNSSVVLSVTCISKIDKTISERFINAYVEVIK